MSFQEGRTDQRINPHCRPQPGSSGTRVGGHATDQIAVTRRRSFDCLAGQGRQVEHVVQADMADADDADGVSD